MTSHLVLVVLLCSSVAAQPEFSGSGIVLDDSVDFNDAIGSGSNYPAPGDEGSGFQGDALGSVGVDPEEHSSDFFGSGYGSGHAPQKGSCSIPEATKKHQKQCQGQYEMLKKAESIIYARSYSAKNRDAERKLGKVTVKLIDMPRNRNVTLTVEKFIKHIKDYLHGEYSGRGPTFNVPGIVKQRWDYMGNSKSDRTDTGITTLYFEGKRLTEIEVFIPGYTGRAPSVINYWVSD